MPSTSTSVDPGTGRGRGATPARQDHPIAQPVQHGDRHRELAQIAGPVALVEDRGQLPPRVHTPRALQRAPSRDPHVLVVGLAALLRPDPAERADHALDWVGARRAQELEQLRLGHLARATVTGPAHDREQRAHLRGMPDRELLGDQRTHRGAHDVRPVRRDLFEQPGGIVGHVAKRVARGGLPPQEADAAHPGPGHMGRAPDVAVVEADHPQPARDHLLAERVAPPAEVEAEPHDEQDRRVLRRAELLVAELDPAPDVREALAHDFGGSGMKPLVRSTYSS